MKNSCTCNKCKSSCLVKPGWFAPDQVEDLLEYFNVDSIDDLFQEGIVIDWYQKYNGGKDVLLLAPNIKGNMGQIQYPAKPSGECVFFDQDMQRCTIYPIRPFECAELHHTDSREKCLERHKEIAGMWSKSNLLDRFKDKVQVKSWSILDYMKGD